MLATGHRSSSQDIRLAARQELSNWALIRRMLTLGWAYRWACLRVLFLQLVVQVLGLLGLVLIGFGIDVIRYGATGDGPQPGSRVGVLPEHWSTMKVVVFVAVSILGVALVHAAIWYRGAGLPE